MPPTGFRKRNHSPDEAARPEPTSKRKATSKINTAATCLKKATLFNAADSPQKKTKSAAETKKFLDSLDDRSDDDKSLSDVESDEFEDVPPAQRRKTDHDIAHNGLDDQTDQNGEDEDEEEMDWEDATGSAQPGHSASAPAPDLEIGDIDVSLNEDGSYVEEPLISLATGKKGPSKRERQIRVLTHQLHVQSLLWHNTVRNSWLNDKQVQDSLVNTLPEGVKREVTCWRENMGMLSKEELQAKKDAAARVKARRDRKGKGKEKTKVRDWSHHAEHLEQGVPNLSHGDPLLRLLKVLTAYWRKRFTVTSPGIRKQGYMALKRLREEIKHWTKYRSDVEEHGERIENIKAFRRLAKDCEGSRDVGAQLFVALLRGIGLETRMVTNLQPAGIGWSKTEEAEEKKAKKDRKAEAESREVASEEEQPVKASAAKVNGKTNAERPSRRSPRGNKAEPINLDDSDSSLSEPPSDHDMDMAGNSIDGDDMSVIDVTPSLPKKKPTKKYDRDLSFPTYWAEVCSPASHRFIPVDPIVLSTIASNEELLQTFEPRGKKAEKARQVMCYTIGFSGDGSAKDVTVRYLKKHQLPGKTKGVRMPTEKVPIYNKRGKVKKYDDYDWFRTVMSIYDKPQKRRTAADDLEDQTDLKPFRPVKEQKEVEKESLQGYKQSADFVLEIHLRREEAIVPGAKPVKTFTAGTGDKAKDHPVYRRVDVTNCKTVESWHKEGRAVKFGEQPMKHVPMRAVTLQRKREMEDTLRETGEKMQQGLYSWDQTEWIIPDPIVDGKIPRNAFGNMDVYVETMVPKGAVHLPLKGTAKICRKLQIDYAEACTGFEFGKQRAVPVLTGVVVAQENAQIVREAWREEQKEIKRKEDTKRTATSLHWWRKMLMGLRIIERMRSEYDQASGDPDAANPFARKAKPESHEVIAIEASDEAGAGGFFRPGHDEEIVPRHNTDGTAANDESDTGGGFFAESEDETHHDNGQDGGSFLVEDETEDVNELENSSARKHFAQPVSLQAMHLYKLRDEDAESEDGASEKEEPKPAQGAPPKKAAAKAKRTTAKEPARRNAKKAPCRPPNGSDGESPLSSPGEQEEDELATQVPSLKRERSSPQVVVTRSNGTPAATRSTRQRQQAKKETPTKSQYFSTPDGTDDNDEADENDDEDDSEPEIVKPSRTTARTRSKR